MNVRVSKMDNRIRKKVKEISRWNYKILKQTYFKSVRRYDRIHNCFKYIVSIFAVISKRALPKGRKRVNVVSLVFVK